MFFSSGQYGLRHTIGIDRFSVVGKQLAFSDKFVIKQKVSRVPSLAQGLGKNVFFTLAVHFFTVAELGFSTLKIIPHNKIDDPCNCIGTIDRRSSVAHNFYAFNSGQGYC